MLRVRDLSVRFGDVQAVEQLSFDVGENQIVGLVGSNGAGKTTTLSAISALVKNRSGRIELDGKDISRLPPHKVVELGLIHVPEGRRLFPFMSVIENLEIGAYGKAARGRRR